MSEVTATPLPDVEVRGLEKTSDDGLIRALDCVDLSVRAREFVDKRHAEERIDHEENTRRA